MFRNILDRLKEAGAYLMQSRLVTLIIIFCVSSSILIGRLFYLQIVKGSDYLENYEYSIRRTTSVAATRGNIYDRNGNLLAYNQLAYSVTINLSTVENSITTDKRSEKNAALNKILDQVLSIVESNGDSVVSSFGIILDSSGTYQFTQSSDTQKLRFIADVYGKRTIDELTEKQQNQSAADIIHYLCTDEKYGYGLDDSTLEPAYILKIINMRYAMALNAYQQYIDTVLASDVSDETAAAIMENKDVLTGVDISEDSIRKYTDGMYFASIIGYTGQISQDEYDALDKDEKKKEILMGTNEKNMTTGSPGKLIITFAIPLMLGNIFQQFYTMADTMIVGQVVGVEALAAVGAGDWLVWLVFGIMTGITQGFSILVAQFYGAREKENLKCAVAKSYIMTALLSVIVLAVSEGAVYHVLLFLQTPDNVIDLTMLYLRLIFAGIPIIAAYNIFAAILRALGNSRSPLIAMTVAALINVGLDLLFVAVFGWGVAGAAVATVIAQGFSALYCLMVLRKIPDIRLEKQDFYRQPAMSLRLLKVATPLAIQNLIISVGGLTVQYVVNGFGFLFVAGFTASNKLYGVLEMAAVSYGYAITTYVGQNLGAKKYQRIRKGVHSGTYMALLTSGVISGVMVLFGRNILSLFVSGEPEQIRQVLDIAYKYLFIMAIFLWVLYLLYVYRSAIQGLGNTLIPLASGIAEFVMRVSVALLLPKLIGEDGIFYAEICAWTSAAVLLFISYMIIIRKYKEYNC